MGLPDRGHLLRIFIGENDHYDGLPLYEWIIRQAREHGLAGATALRGMAGFGAHSRIHTIKLLRLADNLPIVVELVDTLDKIDAFLPQIDHAIKEGLATIEQVQIRFYRGGVHSTPVDG